MEAPAILACLPTDRELVLGMWAMTGLPEEECPRPTDLYTLGNCVHCNRSIWVGPRQKDLMQKDRTLETWCYMCAGANFGAVEENMTHLGGGHQTEGVSRW